MAQGDPVVTVGPDGSGADYTPGSLGFSTYDQRCFNKAVADIGATGNGGSIYVLRGACNPTAEFVLTGSNINVVFEGGANIDVLSGTPLYLGRISPYDSSHPTRGQWMAIFVVGGGSNLVVENLRIQCELTSGAISAVMIAGGVSNCTFYNAYAKGILRFARHHAGYFQLSGTGTPPIYDGLVQGIHWFAPKSDACGVNGIPDGGGTKLVNASTLNPLQDITEFYPDDQNCAFASLDVNAQAPYNGHPCQNYERFDGNGTFTNLSSGGDFAIFLEAAFARGCESFRIWGGKYYGPPLPSTPLSTAGAVLGASSSSVHVSGSEFWQFSTGWYARGLTVVPEIGQAVQLRNLRAIACQVGGTMGGRTNSTTFDNPGTVSGGIRIADAIVDDRGASATAVGLDLSNLNTSSGSSLVPLEIDLQIRRSDFSRLGGTGSPTPLGLGSESFLNTPETRLRDVRGISDRGVMPTPFGSVLMAELRSGGTQPSPQTGTTYRIQSDGLSVSISGGGPGVSVTVYHPDSSILGTLTTGSSNPDPTRNRWYQLQSNLQLQSTGGDPNGTIFAIEPDGTVLVNGSSTFGGGTSYLTMKTGTLIRWVYSVGMPPTVQMYPGTPVNFTDLSAQPTLSIAYPLPRGAAILFASLPGGPAISVTQNGSAIANPFHLYYELGPSGTNSTPATLPSLVFYEVRGPSVLLNCSGATNLAIFDPQGNSLLAGASFIALKNIRLEPGFRLTYDGPPSASTVTSVPG